MFDCHTHPIPPSTFHDEIFLLFLLNPSNAALSSDEGMSLQPVSRRETAQAFSLPFPYFKHLTKLSPCAQSRGLWLIIQTALSACVSMRRASLGSAALPVPWLMSLCSGWAFHRKGLFSIYRHYLQCHLCGIEIYNQQTATGKNMFLLILSEQCGVWLIFFLFFFLGEEGSIVVCFFKELIDHEENKNSLSQWTSDRCKVLKV